jgi:hypothetical protein
MVFPRRRGWLLPALISQTLACTGLNLTPTHPEISVNPTVLDFGTASDTRLVNLQLTISNTGSAPLFVSSVAVTQDPDRLFTVGVAPSMLAVGTSASVNVDLVPDGPPGPYVATLIITSNATNAPQVNVQLEAAIAIAGGGDAGSSDAGSADAGEVDAGLNVGVDAGSPDAGLPDAGVDAGLPDAGGVDAGLPDAGGVDAGLPDAGGVDAGLRDAGEGDAGPADAGPADAGPIDAGAVDAGTCPSGQMMCSTGCVDTNVNPNHCGDCTTWCQANTGCVAGHCVACDPQSGYTTLAMGQGEPNWLSLEGNEIYWTAGTDGTVVRVNVDGGTPSTIVASTAAIEPMAVLTTPSNVYFSDLVHGGVVWGATLTGGNLTDLGGAGAWPGKIGFDSTAGVYWVTQTTGEVWRAPIGSSSAASLVPAVSPSVGGDEYYLMGTDATYVYWLSEGDPSTSFVDGAILRATLTGGTVSTLVSNVHFPLYGTVDSAYAYWTTYDGNLVKFPTTVSGGAPVTLATGLISPRNVIVDATNAYWVGGGTDNSSHTYCNGIVQTVPLSGGEVTTVVYGQFSAYSVAVDQSSIYWADLGNGTVMKTPK